MKNKINKGFTLVELLLIIGAISLASVGVYVAHSKAQDTSLAEEEAKNLNNAILRVQKATSVTMSFEGMSINKMNHDLGGYMSKLNLISINPPSPSELHFNYSDVNAGICTKFVTKMISDKGDISAIVNGTKLPAATDPSIISSACNSSSNDTTIVLGLKELSSGLKTVVPTPPAPPPVDPIAPPPPWNVGVPEVPGIPNGPAPAPYVPQTPITSTGGTPVPLSCLPGYSLVGGMCIAPPPPLPACSPGYERVGNACLPPPPPPAPEPPPAPSTPNPAPSTPSPGPSPTGPSPSPGPGPAPSPSTPSPVPVTPAPAPLPQVLSRPVVIWGNNDRSIVATATYSKLDNYMGQDYSKKNVGMVTLTASPAEWGSILQTRIVWGWTSDKSANSNTSLYYMNNITVTNRQMIMKLEDFNQLNVMGTFPWDAGS